jgi:hypothetical protein
MDSLFDSTHNKNFNTNEIKNNLNSFFNFMLTDYNGKIASKYIDFNVATNALLQKNKFALDHYDTFINNNNNSFPSNANIITIIDDVNNCEHISNKNHKLCVQMWLYIYH